MYSFRFYIAITGIIIIIYQRLKKLQKPRVFKKNTFKLSSINTQALYKNSTFIGEGFRAVWPIFKFFVYAGLALAVHKVWIFVSNWKSLNRKAISCQNRFLFRISGEFYNKTGCCINGYSPLFGRFGLGIIGSTLIFPTLPISCIPNLTLLFSPDNY